MKNFHLIIDEECPVDLQVCIQYIYIGNVGMILWPTNLNEQLMEK